jgi:hypothetical protein
MFKSFVSTSAVAASIPASKSSAASSYESSYDKKKFKIKVSDINFLTIDKLYSYEISVLEDGTVTKGLANLGIDVLNILGFFSDTYIDYPYHWFLIAEAKFDYIYFLCFNLGYEYIYNSKDEIESFCTSLAFIIYSDSVKNKISEEVKKNETLIHCQKLVKELYGEKEMKELCDKLMKIIDKTGEREDLLIDIFTGIFNGKYSKHFYFLIEKGENGSNVEYYKSIDEILNKESENYHDNEANPLETYEMQEEVTVENMQKYIESLPDSYNLIDDNCQDFVRKILNRYKMKEI